MYNGSRVVEGFLRGEISVVYPVSGYGIGLRSGLESSSALLLRGYFESFLMSHQIQI